MDTSQEPTHRQHAAPRAEIDWGGLIRTLLVNVISPRVWISAGFTGFGAGVLAGFIWEPMIVPVFAVVSIAMLIMLCLGNPVKCPECYKRVKVGAKRCHKCGTELVPAGN